MLDLEIKSIYFKNQLTHSKFLGQQFSMQDKNHIHHVPLTITTIESVVYPGTQETWYKSVFTVIIICI
jgi:hypothetical protein